MLRITLRDEKVMNMNQLRAAIKIRIIIEIIKQQKWRWAVYLARRENN